jgi:hypothetical protein
MAPFTTLMYICAMTTLVYMTVPVIATRNNQYSCEGQICINVANKRSTLNGAKSQCNDIDATLVQISRTNLTIVMDSIKAIMLRANMANIDFYFTRNKSNVEESLYITYSSATSLMQIDPSSRTVLRHVVCQLHDVTEIESSEMGDTDVRCPDKWVGDIRYCYTITTDTRTYDKIGSFCHDQFTATPLQIESVAQFALIRTFAFDSHKLNLMYVDRNLTVIPANKLVELNDPAEGFFPTIEPPCNKLQDYKVIVRYVDGTLPFNVVCMKPRV